MGSRRPVRSGYIEPAGGVIFSLEKGQVWASWNGTELNVRLGTVATVVAMMRDFMAQTELGERMVKRETLVRSAFHPRPWASASDS